MTQKIGFLGSDSSHAERFSEIINLEGHESYWPESDARVWAVWGEDAQRTAQVAEYGNIPVVASSPEQAVAESDIVFVITRHAEPHPDLARHAISARKPVFVDKPLTQTPDKAHELLALVRESGVPMTCFSTLRYASDTVRYKKGLQEKGPARYAFYAGTAARSSPNGGLISYGIHTVEIMLECHGADVTSVHAIEQPPDAERSNVTVTCSYEDGTLVTLALLGDAKPGWRMLGIGDDGPVDVPLETHDFYAMGIRRALPVLRGQAEGPPPEQMLRSIQLFAAIEESLQRGAAVDPRTF